MLHAARSGSLLRIPLCDCRYEAVAHEDARVAGTLLVHAADVEVFGVAELPQLRVGVGRRVRPSQLRDDVRWLVNIKEVSSMPDLDRIIDKQFVDYANVRLGAPPP